MPARDRDHQPVDAALLDVLEGPADDAVMGRRFKRRHDVFDEGEEVVALLRGVLVGEAFLDGSKLCQPGER